MSLKIGKNLQKYATIGLDGSIVFNKEFPHYYSWSNATSKSDLINVIQELKEFLEDIERTNSYVQIIPGK